VRLLAWVKKSPFSGRLTAHSVILVTRWLAQARERHGFDSWVTFHAWRKTTATVLDEAGATARIIADQLGHSRVSMAQDVYLGRSSRNARVVAALELADPVHSTSIRGAIRGLSVVSGDTGD
jgi:integrase